METKTTMQRAYELGEEDAAKGYKKQAWRHYFSEDSAESAEYSRGYDEEAEKQKADEP